ncbi:MAG: hypothetical protein LKF71_06575 [Oscillospiraceae bacterium]|nr:hypothetical protein [Oscillospiraceae bacterium]
MIVKTYQSSAVLQILRSGKTYYARKNLGFNIAYQGLIHLLGLHCTAPVFGYLKGHKSCTNGKISSSVLLTLEVPANCLWLTEYDVWADYMYCIEHYTTALNRRKIVTNEECTQRHFEEIESDLREQRSPSDYKIPQVVMERIAPEWLIHYSLHPNSWFQRLSDSFHN